MKNLYKQIFDNATQYHLQEIRFFCRLARENSGEVRVSQLRRARNAALEIKKIRRYA
jgi:hypothetical protein